ncbi:hypothetical protein RDWZM_002701 [Blomia tropicalis]|uniref:phosphatidylserine decarboxylase n=1 Tax=Blomia tropicalis TaxID=40697 RepID=A0A9Q0RSF0_BLOTA|nr:hypothetical protein RDWZM_002701 [Blomia tropicalis]
MSPAVVALARSFESPSDETDRRVDDTNNYEPHHHHSLSSKSSSIGDMLTKHRTPTYPSSYQSSLNVQYDPYHQYCCSTGKDFYKSYHLSYQTTLLPSPYHQHRHHHHLSQHANVRTLPFQQSTIQSVDAHHQRQHNHRSHSTSRQRSARLRRKIKEFQARALIFIQRLALITVSLSIIGFILTRCLQSVGQLSDSIFKHNTYRKLSRYDVIANHFVENSFHLNNQTGSFVDESIQSCSNEDIFNNLFGSTLESNEDLPAIARNVFIRFYALGFLALLFAVSFTCEKIFGKKHSISYDVDGLSSLDEEFDDDIELDDDEDDEGDEDDELLDLYWDCQPTPIRVPKFPIPHVEVADLKISILYLLPLRLISRIWGNINSIPLPIIVRRPLYLWYARTFGCNLHEMEIEDLKQFANLSEFFRRSLKPNVRPIGNSSVVSPADGIYYSINNFLGSDCVPKVKTGNSLYSCVIYLAPGDYHRFHSPTEWQVERRRHFSGRLLSVKPSFVSQVPNLFSINERVVYYGSWKYGFFSMTAVGATNVGTVNVFFDKDLQTNQYAQSKRYQTEQVFPEQIQFNKGDLFGEFNLGSTIVLVYEAPEGHQTQFNSILLNQKVKYGQDICSINC